MTSSPPQFGHRPLRTFSEHEAQKVHSNEQIRASDDSGGRSLLQHSQFGRSCSMFTSQSLSSRFAVPLRIFVLSSALSGTVSIHFTPGGLGTNG